MTDSLQDSASAKDRSDPVISIVTAVYNRVDTLPEALSSVERQSYDAVQHVLIDGGSNDGSRELISARLGSDTIFVSEPDNGIYDALNKGVGRATGEIVGLLHSDDLFASDDVLAKIADAFCRNEVAAVYGDLQYVRRDDPSRVVRHWQSGQFRRDRLGWGWMPPHPALFLRRSVLEKMGAYDTSFRIAGDYDAILRYFSSEGFRAHYIPEVLVKMRVGGESNRSLGRIIRKTREDLRAIRKNDMGGIRTLAFKNLRKVGQFF
jgi:glycosyltransferase involved in cell wall biosynthesis